MEATLNQHEEFLSDLLRFPLQENLIAGGSETMLMDSGDLFDVVKYVQDEELDIHALRALEEIKTDVRQEQMDSQQHTQAVDKTNEYMMETSMNLSDGKYLYSSAEHLQLSDEYAETFYQKLVNTNHGVVPVGLHEEEQKAVNIKEENVPKMLDDTMSETTKTEIKIEIKEETNDRIILPTSQGVHKSVKRSASSRKINQVGKRRKIKVENKVTEIKQEEQEDSIDIETVSDEVPVLEAGDVTSLLEQFEATENSIPLSITRDKSIVKDSPAPRTKFTGKARGRSVKQPMCRNKAYKKSTTRPCNLEVTQELLSKEVIDRIKIISPVQKCKTVTSAISFIPRKKQKEDENCSNSIHRAKPMFSIKKPLKTTHSKVTNVKNDNSNDIKSITTKNTIPSDHDYCISSANSSSNNSPLMKKMATLKLDQNKKSIKTTGYCQDSNLKKNSDLTSTRINDTSKISIGSALSNKPKMNKDNQIKGCQKETSLKQSQILNNSPATKDVNIPNKPANKTPPVFEMKIQSALAKRILRSRQKALDKMQPLQTGKVQQMVSVLKKSLNLPQCSNSINNPEESIVTTTNSSNNEVQNIIIQNTQDTTPQEQTKQPTRKKLNLAEYRSRREQNQSDGNRTNSPMPPTELIYIHHLATTTKPVKNEQGELIWHEREVVPVLRPKQSDVQPKPTVCDVGTQTYESVLEFLTKSSVPVENRDIPERCDERTHNLSSSSQSRSENKSRSRSGSSRSKSRDRNSSGSDRKRRRSRTRSRSRRASRDRNKKIRGSSNDRNSRSRSQSRGRSNNRTRRSRSRSCRRSSSSRQRKISHRRSSISSSPSSSNTCSSRSRYCRSRSRSRSGSSSQYYSSSSSQSKYGRNRWSNRQSSNDRERSYDRYRRHLYNNHRDRDWKSGSPLYPQPRRYENWFCEEKTREMEERRVVYVGSIEKEVSKADLHQRFGIFGTILDISLHFRERGDNYGFVTFAYKDDAYNAVEHGNDNPDLRPYDLCFGGRRAFCQVKYEDLDGMANGSLSNKLPSAEDKNTFDYLLNEEMKRHNKV